MIMKIKDKLFSEKLSKNSDLLSKKFNLKMEKHHYQNIQMKKKLKFNIIYYLVYLKIINFDTFLGIKGSLSGGVFLEKE